MTDDMQRARELWIAEHTVAERVTAIRAGLLTADDRKALRAIAAALRLAGPEGKFKLGDRVTKIKGSKWTGFVVGTYSTALTPEGYAVESETEVGSVQIYPAAALAALPPAEDS